MKRRFELPVEQRDDDIGDQVFTTLKTSRRYPDHAEADHRLKLLRMLELCRPGKGKEEEMVLVWKAWPETRGPYTTPKGARWKTTSRHALVRKAWLRDWLEPLS